MANLAFIDGRSNRRILATPPKEYVARIVKDRGKMQFDKQMIPTSPELLEIENFEAFLSERRTRIAAELNRFLEQ
jgi:hypothetical protein